MRVCTVSYVTYACISHSHAPTYVGLGTEHRGQKTRVLEGKVGMSGVSQGKRSARGTAGVQVTRTGRGGGP